MLPALGYECRRRRPDEENMERELALRIVLEKPPRDVDFGLQKGRGSDFETIQTQSSKAKNLSFDFSVVVKGDRKNAMPRFSGPLVQGSPNQRFIYIDIGTYAGQTDSCWSRRLKIPLSGITWKMIDDVSANAKGILEARVPGTGRDGGPNCATVKPFEGWKLSEPARR